METQIQALQSSVDQLASTLRSRLSAPPDHPRAPVESLYAPINPASNHTVTPSHDSLMSGPSPAIASLGFGTPSGIAAKKSVETDFVPQSSERWHEDEDPLQAGATSAPLREMLSRAAAVSDVGRHHGSSPRQHKRKRTDISPSGTGYEFVDDADRDPVSAGLCTEAEGRRLFDTYVLAVKSY
jgi:hypothetical protein